MFQTTTRTATHPAVRPTRGLKLTMWATLLAVGGTVAMASWAQTAAPEAGAQKAPHARHMKHHGPRGEGFGGHGFRAASPEQVDRAVERMLRGLDATEAQTAQIKQIARAAAVDLKAQRDAGRALREQELQLFAAPVVDARAVEALRQQRLAQHDQASKRMTQALLEASAVLSPDQRAKLVTRMKEREQRMKERFKDGRPGVHGERHLEHRRGAASAPAQ